MFERPFPSMEPEEEGQIEINIQTDQGDTGSGSSVEEGTDDK